MASMPPPPQPLPNPSKHPIGKTPYSHHDSESDPESDSDTATPLAGAPVTPRFLAPDPQEAASQRLLDQLKSALVEGYPWPVITAAEVMSLSRGIALPPPKIRPRRHSYVLQSSCGSIPLLGAHLSSASLQTLMTKILRAAEDDGGAKDTRGESRGRSARLDREKFAVDFHPSDFGILDAIKQVLLPGAVESRNEAVREKEKRKETGKENEKWSERKEHWGVRAELCQLNQHVDERAQTTDFATTARNSLRDTCRLRTIFSSRMGFEKLPNILLPEPVTDVL
ncbi:hypothetical protein LSUB1_G002010 [Lachnellula subtilissima]|uniref:Uncharacterized protein n=1 Tax=Lachnellula subtilissima TaxID=602034 RepID=A0A8H8UAG6_9HELO|nr:hypothetical protein LSUB1_G002010 [Lachnellula subtilissima]